MRRRLWLGAVHGLTLLAAVPAQAQLNGSHTTLVVTATFPVPSVKLK